MVEKMSESVWETTPTSTTPINVRSTNDYLLGDAIARRYDLYAPLKGERLLRFFEVLVAAHDAYNEALKNPIRVLCDLHRPPLTDTARNECVTAAQELLAEHRTLRNVLSHLGDMTYDEFRSNVGITSQVTEEMWCATETFLLETPNCMNVTLTKQFGINRENTEQFRVLYRLPSSRTNGRNKPKMPQPAHARMIELIRDGKHGTEIASILKQEFDVQISRSLVTKTRTRLSDRGEL